MRNVGLTSMSSLRARLWHLPLYARLSRAPLSPAVGEVMTLTSTLRHTCDKASQAFPVFHTASDENLWTRLVFASRCMFLCLCVCVGVGKGVKCVKLWIQPYVTV